MCIINLFKIQTFTTMVALLNHKKFIAPPATSPKHTKKNPKKQNVKVEKNMNQKHTFTIKRLGQKDLVQEVLMRFTVSQFIEIHEYEQGENDNAIEEAPGNDVKQE